MYVDTKKSCLKSPIYPKHNGVMYVCIPKSNFEILKISTMKTMTKFLKLKFNFMRTRKTRKSALLK